MSRPCRPRGYRFVKLQREKYHARDDYWNSDLSFWCRYSRFLRLPGARWAIASSANWRRGISQAKLWRSCAPGGNSPAGRTGARTRPLPRPPARPTTLPRPRPFRRHRRQRQGAWRPVAEPLPADPLDYDAALRVPALTRPRRLSALFDHRRLATADQGLRLWRVMTPAAFADTIRLTGLDAARPGAPRAA